ncbi:MULTISPECIES: DUF6159 family protein [Legionella]|uniref:Transmembrane protein n=1 Tax=Legionella drozanskii LLAP-1 TaxID=1212489 RepID=A0A0W0SQL7_9GAMM|nr:MULTISPECIES: DUF6159 family protein [Legionella]KTC85627.1 hypothetical protein Ldro_1952 [Legionella drozanskii LLAP-1]PJE15167.1 MAG: hypothetical protein CK430_04605 [Legionella sp.]
MLLIQGFRNSCYFLRSSLKFLKKNPDLIILPVLSIIALVILLFSLIKMLIYLQVNQSMFIIGLVLIYFLLAFVAVLFNAAFVACVIQRLQGGRLTLFQAMLISLKKAGALLKWTMISATLSVLFSSFEHLSDALAKLIATLFGFSWTVNTHFVLPIMVNENLNAIKAFQKSIRRVGKGWRNIVSINLLVFLVLVALGGLAYLFASFFLHSQYTLNLTINLPLCLLLLICWLVSIKTFNAIYNSALYLHLNEKKQDYFDDEILNRVIIKK